MEDILKEALPRYKAATDAVLEGRKVALEDLEFTYNKGNGQWPADVKKERAGRPMLTINKLKKFVKQLIGQQRQNRPSITVKPVDSNADPQIAELYSGIIRQIEYQSSADIVFDTAYKYAISGGFGFFRFVTEYVDENSFEQEIFMKRIINPFSVHFDPNVSEFDYSDAQYCFIEENIPKKRFEALFPGKSATDFESNKVGDEYAGWFEEDSVRIVEYFFKEPVQKKIVQLSDGNVYELTPDIKRRIEATRLQVLRERDVESHVVKWCKLCGGGLLNEVQEWPGIHIPVVPVLGDEIVINGKKHYDSLINDAKDPQRMYNYWRSAATELVALAPKAPYLLTPEQVENHETMWEEANTANRAYLLYNNYPGLQKPSREPQTQIPSAVINEAAISSADIDDVIGQYEASKGMPSNERSGKAIRARQDVSSLGTFSYIDNLRRSIVYGGRILIDLIPKIYDTQRALRIRGEDDKETLVTANHMLGVDGEGRSIIENDLSVGRYDLVADVGASHSTRRQEATDMMIQSMQYAPTIAPEILDLLFENMDIPGAKELAARVKEIREGDPNRGGKPGA